MSVRYLIAVPPPRRWWWQFWIPRRPVVLREGAEYHINQNEEFMLHGSPRRGWKYRVAVFLE